MFGPFYWSLKHAATWFWMKPLVRDSFEDALPYLRRGELQLCKYLNCPACVFHCVGYHDTHPQVYSSPEEWWTYVINFHNTVNERTQKRSWSSEEAAEYQEENEEEQKNSMQHWIALWLTTHTFNPYQPNPNQAQGQEKEPENKAQQEESGRRYLDFLSDMTYFLPACIMDSQLAQSMRAFIQGSPVPLTQADASLILVGMFNLTQPFPRSQLEVETEWKRPFMLTPEQALLTKRADDMRKEDHKKILDLEVKLQQLKGRLGDKSTSLSGDSTDPTDPDANESSSSIKWIWVIVIVSLMSVILAFYGYRFHQKQSYGSNGPSGPHNQTPKVQVVKVAPK